MKKDLIVDIIEVSFQNLVLDEELIMGGLGLLYRHLAHCYCGYI